MKISRRVLSGLTYLFSFTSSSPLLLLPFCKRGGRRQQNGVAINLCKRTGRPRAKGMKQREKKTKAFPLISSRFLPFFLMALLSPHLFYFFFPNNIHLPPCIYLILSIILFIYFSSSLYVSLSFSLRLSLRSLCSVLSLLSRSRALSSALCPCPLCLHWLPRTPLVVSSHNLVTSAPRHLFFPVFALLNPDLLPILSTLSLFFMRQQGRKYDWMRGRIYVLSLPCLSRLAPRALHFWDSYINLIPTRTHRWVFARAQCSLAFFVVSSWLRAAVSWFHFTWWASRVALALFHHLIFFMSLSFLLVSSDEDDVDMPVAGASKSLALRIQKKFLGMTLKSKEQIKGYIDDDTGRAHRFTSNPHFTVNLPIIVLFGS